MNCIEEKVDLRKLTEAEREKEQRETELMFRFNQAMPHSDEYLQLMEELPGALGEGSYIASPVQGVCWSRVSIGNNVYVNSNALMMARGGITISRDVMIASNVQLLTNNHDPYNRHILLCKPIVIEEGAWIGAGATILPGVSVGRYAIVAASAVVTKDVPDYAVVMGTPARVVRMLEEDRFPPME